MKQRRSYTGENNPCYRHGWSKTRLYIIWGQMKQGCSNPNYKEYYLYGGKGIIVCDRWLKFIPFRDWSLNNGYSEGLQIDRKNSDDNYEPSNCRWYPLLKIQEIGKIIS